MQTCATYRDAVPAEVSSMTQVAKSNGVIASTNHSTQPSLPGGQRVVPLSEQSKKRIHATFKGPLEPVRLEPSGVVVPKAFPSLYKCIWNFEFRPSDVVILSYQKCGTTWIQDLLWTMIHNPDLNNPMASVPITIRSIYLESDSFVCKDVGPPYEIEQSAVASVVSGAIERILLHIPSFVLPIMLLVGIIPKLSKTCEYLCMRYCPSLLAALLLALMKTCPTHFKRIVDYYLGNASNDSAPAPGFFLRICEHTTSRRVIKTHLPFSLFDKNAFDKTKVIFIIRDIKDVTVSLYHYSRLVKLTNYTGTFAEFVDTFMENDLLFGNYILHLKEAFARRNDPNLLIVRYKDLKKQPFNEINKINKFIDAQLSDAQIDKIAEYTSFSNMKKRENHAVPIKAEEALFNAQIAQSEGGFYRNGKIGDWKNKYTPELSAKVDKWINQNLTAEELTFIG